MKQEVAPPLAEGRYRLTDVLGVGGMAVVYRAHDTRLDVSRAIKMLRPELDDRARERFDTEARTMAKLHHPNVVLVHDVAEDGDRAYLVMEFIEGGSISDRLHAYGSMPPRMAVDVTIAVLEGLEAAHDKGIVHRDIKPHNIMVADDGTVKVTDFGIAQVSSENLGSTKTGAMIGTWAYMAPEQRADAKHVDHRADVFAVGCTLYKMVTNHEPFDLYNTELHDELFEDVPELLRDPIKNATRYKADNRFDDVAGFRDALKAVRDQLPEDPEDVPPLGASIESERATFMPTIFDPANPSSDVSNPTLSRPASTEEVEQPLWTWAALAAMGAVMFLSLGIGAGAFVMFGGLLAFSVTDESPAGSTPSEAVAPGPEADPPIETPDEDGSVDAQDEDPPDGDDVSDDPDAEATDVPGGDEDPTDVDVEPDSMDPPDPTEESPDSTEDVQPAPEPAPASIPDPEPSPRPSPRPEPRPEPTKPAGMDYVPEPEPDLSGTFQLSVNSRPAGFVCLNGNEKCGGTPWTHRLEPGLYRIEIASQSDANDLQVLNIDVDADKKVCWDFNTGAKCR